MLQRSITKKGIEFTVQSGETILPFNDWINTDDCIYYFPLSSLVDNGYAEICDNSCIVPFESIFLLDQEEQDILGLSIHYNGAIRLRSNGMLNTSSFCYSIDFMSHVPDGDLYNATVNGCFVSIAGKYYLLSVEQYDLTNSVYSYNNLAEDEKTTENNLRCFADIKKKAEKCNCELDSYLSNENVFVPEKIKIEISQDEQGYTIDPVVDITEKEKFKSTFDRLRKVQNVYPIASENGERTRVVINKEQKNNLEELKNTGGRHRTREEIKKIIESPTEYFDPDQFDISELYSERVIEIGLYKPKFYPFISPYKSCWIAGATVESPENGSEKIEVKTEDDYKELKNAILKAESECKDIVSFRNTEIEIGDAKFLASVARAQLNQPEKPVETKDTLQRKVLIIKENAENLEFVACNKGIESKGQYTLYTDPFLSKDFYLKSHQEEGVAWLQYLYMNKANGCLLADDMGLGKTLQVLYFIDWHSRLYKSHNTYFIFAPVSLIENWEMEYGRFFKSPRLKICRLSSKDVPRKFNREVVESMQSMDIILTNYESLRISQLNFCAVEFDIVVLDEAQKIKSPGTLVTNAAKALKAHFKVAMTGTPVENTLLDLWCIMDFCVPGLLGNAKSFSEKYQSPLKNADTDLVELGNEIHEKLGVHFLRRLKTDAAKDLPPKIIIKERQIMPDIQETYYNRVVSEYNSGIQPNMLVTIRQMKDISEHPYLSDGTLFDHDEIEQIASSARLQKTISFLDEIKSRDEKVILFVDRKPTQRLLQKIIYSRYGFVAKIINGDTPSISTQRNNSKQSRQSCVNEFQKICGFNAIIMSPVAAGMGLNVTAANHVIHYSRHWNPAKENQATDRAYRIGQEKEVFVYYPMAVSNHFHSFDETLDDLLEKKTNLATSTIFPTERAEVRPEEFSNILFSKDV